MASGLSIEGLSQVQELGPSIQRQQTNQNSFHAGEQGSATGEVSTSFADMIEKSMDKVNRLQLKADHSVKDLIAGRTKNIHSTMLDLERADLSLKLMMQVRNKIVDAYREIMRMQI